ncbi:MAG: heavy metal sensor histidine kinase [Acidobacteria bacterium]|nr:heavy metal sensor histidine kinase [Acidobacteriota bacterium]
MSSKSAERRAWSITATLTVLYAASAFGLLLLSSVFLFWTLHTDLDRKTGQFLADKIREVRGIMAEHGAGTAALEREILRETAAPMYWRYYARTVGEAGETTLETPGMDALLPASIFPRPVHTIESTNAGQEWKAADGRLYILMAAWADLDPRRTDQRIIQIGLDVSEEDAIIADYKRKMAGVLLAGVALAATAGAFVARSGLRPLGAIATAAARIEATHLQERIGQTGWPRELSELAAVFDAMLDRLEDSFTRLSQFSADLAHELRTPINNLVGGAEVALTRARTTDEYRSVLESSLEEYGRLSRMIDKLLFLARADRGRAPLMKVPLDARAELEAVVDFHEAVAAERGIQVSCAGTGHLVADQQLFRRAISNLLSNSLNHTPHGGEVEVSVEESEAGAVDVLVRDNGCGIPPEHLPWVFDRFYRVESSRPSQPGGTGLGLAIVRSIMDLHMGVAKIQSEPGKGTTVVLSFPGVA